MQITADDLMLVTGATGLVGSHVAERAAREGVRTRAIVRGSSDRALLDEWGVETVEGDMTDAASLQRAAEGATIVVHCAAKVGDWGPVEQYRTVNVDGLEHLLNAVEANGVLKRFVHVSSLGVYASRDHHGTDESESPNKTGIDGYTLTKVESEELVLRHVAERQLPAVVLRPGFVYGPRDRTVFPKLMARLRDGSFKFLGDGSKLMNNTYVGNLVDAIWLAIERDDVLGEVFNVRDPRLVSKREFMNGICEHARYDKPTGQVPLGVAKFLAKVMEGSAKLLGKKEAPLLSKARIKFLGNNLDFCIDKAKRELGYAPAVDFEQGIATTMAWFGERTGVRN
jgi:2-alkyl-3-oxoalkanoate reductase